MNTWLVILFCLLTLVYMVVRLMKSNPIHLSRFEIERRAKDGEIKSVELRDRLRALPYVRSVRWFLSLVLFAGITVVLVALAGPGSGLLLAVVLGLAIAWGERWSPLKRLGARLYGKAEPRLNRLYSARRYLMFLPLDKYQSDVRIDSEAELLHLLDGATFLEPERRRLIHSALEFTGLSVSDAMSSRRSIKPVDKSEVLGPLALDELYKTGRQAFVVIDGTVDTVVGVLKLDRLTSLDMQDSPAALKAMTPEVHFIDADTPITDGLSYLRSSKAPFLVVQNPDGTTAGLLTMDNILRCLFSTE